MKTSENQIQNKRAEKKGINIKSNSQLYFQVGLIVSMLLVFFAMEIKIEKSADPINLAAGAGVTDPAVINYVLDEDIPKIKKPVKNPEKKTPIVRKAVKSSSLTVVDNTIPTEETPLSSNIEAPIISKPSNPEPPKATKPSNIANVEFVPVFPGCESFGNNEDRLSCFSSKINSFINKNFRKSLLGDMESNKVQKIYVQFKIDANGVVTDVVANSHIDALKKEAQRVIEKLPSMKPGRQGDQAVEVLYTLPIVLDVQ